MGQGGKAARQQAMIHRQRRRRWRTAFFITVPVMIVAIVAAVALTNRPGYSGFDAIGTRPAVVEVFLPG